MRDHILSLVPSKTDIVVLLCKHHIFVIFGFQYNCYFSYIFIDIIIIYWYYFIDNTVLRDGQSKFLVHIIQIRLYDKLILGSIILL